MVPSECKTLTLFAPTATVAAASTTTACMDRLGWDYAVIDIVECEASASNQTQISTLHFCESDTAIANYAGGTPIVALVGAAAASATAGFTLPTPSTSTLTPLGSTYRFNVDLRQRKRYMYVEFTPEHTCGVSCIAHLFRRETGDAALAGPSVATATTVANQCRLVVSA